MNTPMTPPERRHFDLDEMELHSDIAIGSDAKNGDNKAHRESSPWPLRIVLSLLLLGLGFFAFQTYTLNDQLKRLQTNKGAVDQSLTQTQSMASTLQTDLDETATALTTSKEENKDLRREIDQRKRNINQLKNQLKESKSSQRKAEKASQATSKKLKRVESDLARARKKAATEQELHQQQLTELNAEWDRERSTLTKGKKQAENRLKRERTLWEKQQQEEAQASLALIEERANLKKENAGLKADLARARKNLADNKDLVQDLSTVSVGELVPYSNDLITPQVTYREPYSEDPRIPRKFDSVTFLVLVNEIGAVDNALVVPGQQADQVLVAALLRNLGKWKFRPPSLKGVKVRYWHTIVLSSR